MKYNSKRRKNKFVLITLVIGFTTISLSLSTQNADFNLKKYWYLRWRLTNYFMVVGEGPGKSLPAGIREKYFNDTVNRINYYSTALDFGDGPNYLARYIGVLATEYKLLSDNNQSTSTHA